MTLSEETKRLRAGIALLRRLARKIDEIATILDDITNNIEDLSEVLTLEENNDAQS